MRELKQRYLARSNAIDERILETTDRKWVSTRSGGRRSRLRGHFVAVNYEIYTQMPVVPLLPLSHVCVTSEHLRHSRY